MSMNRAGWDSCEITPPLGLPMGGRGPRFAAGSEILSPLQAGVTVLEDAAHHRVVFVSADVISLDNTQNDALRIAIASAVNTTPDAVIINASHTHSGPMLSYERYATLKPKPQALEDYEREMDQKILRLAISTAQKMQPVRVSWRESESNIGINRRVSTPDGVVMAPNADGFYHRQLWTLDLQSLQNPEERCVLFSHGCHPVIVYSSRWTAISSEWPGRSREILSEQMGSGTHFQFLQGLAGNIRPRVLADFENRKFRPSTPEDLETTAQQFARDVGSTLAQAGDELELQLGACRSCFLAERAAPPPREFWEEMAASDDELTQEVGSYWQTRYGENAIAPYRSQPWPIGLLRFAPGYVMATLAGEPLGEWIEVLRRALPGQRVVACGYTHSSAGYLPTDKLLAEGGYEVERSAYFSKSGPGALLPGLDAAVTQTLHKMQAFIEAS
jgi:hypothetical protein